MKRLFFPSWTFPLALLGVCLFSYGPAAPYLGFYWDDWPAVWYLHVLGPGGFSSVFAADRPLLGIIFTVTTTLVGETPLAWQFFAIFTRWLASLALWWMLISVWPRNRFQTGVVALLFAIYPGFLQQPLAVTYSADWIALSLFFSSFAMMIWAVRRPRFFWPLMGLSWLLAAYVMFADEYYFGLEFLRPVFLWIVHRETIPEPGRRLKRTILEYLPFLGIAIFFLYWRLFVHVSPRGQVSVFDRLQTDPLSTLLGLWWTVWEDLYEAAVQAWVQIFRIQDITTFLGPRLIPVYIAIVLFVTGIALMYLWRLRFAERETAEIPPPPQADPQWGLWAVGIGLLALLLGGWPFWVTELPIRLQFPWDRFTLALMFGTSFLWAGLLEFLVRSYRLKVLILSVMIGLAAGFHLHNANHYRKEWEAQKRLFWQLIWRAPGLEPGTTLVTTRMPLVFYSDNSLTAPLNWIYSPENHSRDMDYLLYDLQVRLGLALPELANNLPIEQDYRATTFTGSTSQVLTLYYPATGCIKILDPVDDQAYPLRHRSLGAAIDLSRPELIQPAPVEAARPPAHIFGPEPQPDWCTYFQKADLARQLGDWETVNTLARQAEAAGFSPDDPLEWLPFIEAAAHQEDWQAALQMTLETRQASGQNAEILCRTWARIRDETPEGAEKTAALEQVVAELNCE